VYKNRHNLSLGLRWLCSLAVLFALLSAPVRAADVKIGVLALRGPEKVAEMWSATADYLDHALPGNTFHIVPLGFDEVRLAVRQGRVDFVLVNSSYYVELESLYGVSAIATLKNRFDGGPGFSSFGGVIFTRADRSDIRELSDLRRKTFAATDASSLGGWQVGWREMRHQGLDPGRDFKRLTFEHTHDAVVYAVRDGRADAGTVRTDTLERMAAEGKIRLEDFFVLNQQHDEGFPLLLSTMLYPEWPMAKLRQVPDDLAVKVAIALMQMPADVPAAVRGEITGWTLPLNYQPVHDLLKELRIGPYSGTHRLTMAELMTMYGYWLILVLAFVLTILAIMVYVGRINRRLRQNQLQLENLNSTLEARVQERAGEVVKLLAREHFLRGVVGMVADVNQILITSNSMEEMLKACCDRLIANSEYRFAWVGLLQDGKIEVAAKSYGSAEFMRNLATCLDKGPSRDAFADNRTVIENDPGRIVVELARNGVRAMIAMPLRQDVYSEPLGVLCVLTARAEGFDREEVSMLEQLAGDIGFAVHAFDQRKETRKLQQERIRNYEETILSLVDMIEKRDTYTAGHTRRVAQYCELIATRMGLSPEEIEKLKRAAILHDIGKIAIPDAVLLKPGKLTPLEYDLIKQHADEGYRTLVSIDMYKELAEIMRFHHEREDGSGYPHGLEDGQIPRLSQIMAVADAFDAMTTNRIYKPRKEVAVALEELRQLAGTHYAPDVVEAACEALRDVKPPPISDQMPKTALERQRFAYFFDDQLTGAHNASYLQLMLSNGPPVRYSHAYMVLLHHFSGLNVASGWAAGNAALTSFAAFLMTRYPDAVLFRVMGDDFALLSAKPLDLAGLKAGSPLQGTEVDIEIRELDLRDGGIEYLRELI
jgi:two-component system sensor histidine kinase TtrS